MWVKHGECGWIPRSEDVRNEGKYYILNDGKVRIGDCLWKYVPFASVSLEDKEKLWQNHRQHIALVHDPVFERRLNSLPPELHHHPILETVASYLEEEVKLLFVNLLQLSRGFVMVFFLTASH